jgi:hypothetical protein
MIIKLLTQITAVLIKILDALNWIIKMIKFGGEHGREITKFFKRRN